MVFKINMLFAFILVLSLSSLAIADIDVENNNSENFKISGYFDGCFAEWGDYNTIPSREFFVRRAGFEINSDLTEHISAELKIETRPDQLFLKDAFVEWAFSSDVVARFGQFKKENLLAGSISTWKLNQFERPQVYSLYENLTYSGRDLGTDFSVELPMFYGMEVSGTAGVFNGEERAGERENNQLLYTMRGNIEVPRANLALGASIVAHREGIEDSTPAGYSFSDRQMAFSADLQYFYEFSNWYKFGLAAEYATGDNWEQADVVAGDEAPTYASYWGTAYLTYKPWNVPGIEAISLALTLDNLSENTDYDYYARKTSIIASIYPNEHFRFRLGAVKNKISAYAIENNYTDYIAEIGLRF